MIYRGEEVVEIPAGEITLEGALWRPPEGAAPLGLGLVCHPHPALGGDMDNKNAVHLARSLQALGLMTLRFNFRGVGASTGAHDEGRGEVEDVRAALAFLRGRWGEAGGDAAGDAEAAPTVVAGYSFGSYTGLKGTFEDPGVDAWIALAPPWELFDFGFLRGFKGPLLMMVGEDDPVCTPADARRLIQDLDLRAELLERAGADHLFHGAGPWIRAGVGGFVGPRLRTPRRS